MFKDQSILDSATRTRLGKVSDILTASLSPDSKILNGLSFQDPWAGIHRTSFSSDAFALTASYMQEGWRKKAPDISHLRWSLAATKDAFHHWHIDSDGYGTFIDVISGSKWWIVARPKNVQNVDIFNTATIFMTYRNLEDLDVEAILLQPGSELCVQDLYFPFY